MKTNTAKMSIYVIGALFFIFGFVTWVNSVLIPFLKQICELSDFQAYFVTFAFYLSYLVMALPSSWVLSKTGFVKGMSLGLISMAVGSLIFIPAALDRSYVLFLIGLFVQGAGLSLLQTASNPYVTILGPIESAAQRISIMGICNKIAGMIGIFLLSYLLFSNITEESAMIATLTGEAKEVALTDLAGKIISPYIWIAVILFFLAAMILFAKLPEIDPESNADEGSHSRESIFKYPYFWLGVMTIFFYVGAEVIAIDTLPLYGQYMGMESVVASKLGTFSLIALIVGYSIGIATVPKYVSQRMALIICTILNLAFLCGAVMTTGITSIVFIILLSFGNSLMWPSIWPLAIVNLGKYTEMASAFMIMGISGGAVFPLIYGAISDSMDGNRQIPYLLLVPCYLIILFFATKGYNIGRKN